MGRRALECGELGTVSSKKQPDGQWRGVCSYRDQTGTLKQANAFRTTKTAAEKASREAAERLAKQAAGVDGITPDTTIAVLAQRWLEQIEREATISGNRRPQTVRDYRWNVENVILGPDGIGNLRIREATTGRLHGFVQREAETRPTVARKCRSVLGQMFAFAAQHDALVNKNNPVRDTASVGQSRPNKQTLTAEESVAFLAQIAAWQRGEAIPGCAAAPRGGQGRSKDLLDVVVMYMGSGARTGEVLALRWEDVDFTSTPATITISGTVVTAGGTRWQPEPKTASGHRKLPLHDEAREVLLRRKAARSPGSVYVFESQVGGLRSPANMRRQFRQARGSNFDWVIPRTFRKTAATAIDDKYGDDAAADWLGHSSTVPTRKHYINRAATVADYTSALDAYFGRTVERVETL